MKKRQKNMGKGIIVGLIISGLLVIIFVFGGFDYLVKRLDITGRTVVTDCVPKTCDELGKQCGYWNDKCGVILTCGFCEKGFECINGECKEAGCVDSDVTPNHPDGINYYVAGTVIKIGEEFKDYCFDNYNLQEYYCSGTLFGKVYKCEQGCENNKCKSDLPITCSNNNDCGEDVGEKYCEENKFCVSSTINVCNFHGTIDSFCSVGESKKCEECENGCEGDACIVIVEQPSLGFFERISGWFKGLFD